MILSHIVQYSLIKSVPCNFHRSGNHNPRKRDNRNIRSSGSNVYDQISKGLGHIHPGSDCRSYRFLHHIDISGTSLIGCFLHCLFLNLCNSTGNTDTDPGLAESSSSYCSGYKVFQHLLCNCIINDHALSDGTDDLHI